MSWGSVWILWWLLFLLPFAWMCKRFLLSRNRAWKELRYYEHSKKWRNSFVLVGFGYTCIVIALAQPRWGYETVQQEKELRDIVVVLDVSRSMLAQDVLPSRIERAHWELQTFVESVHGERIALVVFAQRAYVRMPLSKEYPVFLDLLKESHPNQIRSQGSDVSTALLLASELFSDDSGAHAIVLVSDGEDHSQNLEETVQQIAKKGISVYSLGIGTTEGGTIPLSSGAYVRDERGEIVVSTRKDTGLQYISQHTGGIFTLSQAGRSDWDILYTKGIEKLRSRARLSEEEQIWNELFVWPLGLGMICFLAVYVVRLRRLV